MREKLLADREALDAGEVSVVAGGELVVTRALLLGELLIPALVKAAADGLDPLLDFVVLRP